MHMFVFYIDIIDHISSAFILLKVYQKLMDAQTN